jgi:hypothetical protein
LVLADQQGALLLPLAALAMGFFMGLKDKPQCTQMGTLVMEPLHPTPRLVGSLVLVPTPHRTYSCKYRYRDAGSRGPPRDESATSIPITIIIIHIITGTRRISPIISPTLWRSILEACRCGACAHGGLGRSCACYCF